MTTRLVTGFTRSRVVWLERTFPIRGEVTVTEKTDLNDAIRVCKALRSRQRLETLLGLQNGKTLTDIADDLNKSYGSVQGYAEELEKAALVENASGSRKLTPVGEFVLANLSSMDRKIKREKVNMALSEIEEISTKYALAELPDEEIQTLLDNINPDQVREWAEPSKYIDVDADIEDELPYSIDE